MQKAYVEKNQNQNKNPNLCPTHSFFLSFFLKKIFYWLNNFKHLFCLYLVLTYNCILFLFSLLIPLYYSSERSGLLNWRRSFFNIFSIFHIIYLQGLQNWYCSLVSGLLPSFPGWKRYVCVTVLCVVLSLHLPLQSNELTSWSVIGLPWDFWKDNIFLGCLELVQITKASTGEESATFHESSATIPFPEDPLQWFECCSNSSCPDSSCSDFF